MSVIRHPGPPVTNRWTVAPVDVERAMVRVARGQDLLDALHTGCQGWDGAAVDLAGLEIGPYAYVMPDHAHDGRHAAWYSPTYSGSQARIEYGTALLGRHGTAPWFHAHATWADDGRKMGHLRPGEVSVAKTHTVPVWRWRGAHLALRQDPETEFPIYHLDGGHSDGIALLVRLAPHEDLVTRLDAIARHHALRDVRVIGLGSLIGAAFETGPNMTSPISEVLVAPGARLGNATHLPVVAVDTDGQIHEGVALPNKCPVLVTFELLLLADFG